MSWTTPQDIKDIWITAKALPSDTKLEKFISIVELQITTHYPRIQERIDEETLSLDLVKNVVAEIVKQYLLTEGQPYSQQSQAYTGVASMSVSYNDNARTSLTLTEADYALLAPKQMGPIFTVRITPGYKGV